MNVLRIFFLICHMSKDYRGGVRKMLNTSLWKSFLTLIESSTSRWSFIIPFLRESHSLSLLLPSIMQYHVKKHEETQIHIALEAHLFSIPVTWQWTGPAGLIHLTKLIPAAEVWRCSFSKKVTSLAKEFLLLHKGLDAACHVMGVLWDVTGLRSLFTRILAMLSQV